MEVLIKEDLKKEREAKGLSRERLAALSGLTSQTIYRAETTGKITFDNYLRIINALKNYVATNNTNQPDILLHPSL